MIGAFGSYNKSNWISGKGKIGGTGGGGWLPYIYT